MKFKILLFIYLGLMAACGPKEFHEGQDFATNTSDTVPSSQSKITNGEGAMPGSYIANNTVAIVSNFNEKNKTYFGFCSAVRLNSKLVVTAAHCISEIQKMRVVSGVNIHHAISFRENIFEIEKVIVHDQFKTQAHATDRRYNDIALVKLTRPLPDNDDDYTLALQMENSETTSQYIYANIPSDQYGLSKLNTTIAGFGVSFHKNTSNETTTKFIGTLTEAPVRIKTFDYSQRIIKLSPENLSQACVGDSGGALFVWRGERYYLQAITISIKEDGSTDPFAKTICEKESSYLNLDFFKSWIVSKSRELN